MLVKIYSLLNGLSVLENVKVIRIKSKDYNLLIMKDYVPIIGEIEGDFEVETDKETKELANIRGYYVCQNNGIFMGMSNYHIFLLSIKSIAYVFMIWALFYDSLEIIHFIFFISLHVLFDLFAKRFLALIPNLFNYTFISFLLFSKLVFYQYLVEVGFVWYVFLLMLLLGIFIFLYGSYFYFSDVFFLLKQNKYVKKVKKKK